MKRFALCATAVALIVAGCGGGDELTKSQLASKANAVCKKFSEEGQKLGSPDLTDPAKAEDYFNKAKDLAQKQQDELADLTPPSSLEDDYQKLIDASGEATDLLADLASAAGDKDQKKGAELVQKLTPISQKVDEASNAVGATDCASS